MVINDFNLVRLAVPPFKTDPVLIIDTNAVLAPAVSSQSLQAVAGRNPECIKRAWPHAI
jgi:hypothetical protein